MSDLVPDDAEAGTDYAEIRGGIVALLEAARRAAARSVNALMTASYWTIGQRIVSYEQGGRGRAVYGEALIERLADDLTNRFGRGFSRQNLWQMRAFHLAWPKPRILQTASGESPDLLGLAQAFPLPWSA
jgi:DUF1016 N-terminal domain